MATRYTMDAAGQINPIFGQSEQMISGQLPQVQQLFDTLIQGLQTQQGAETAGIVQSAGRRGVGRPALAADLTATLGNTANLEATKLGAQRAGDIAGIRQRLGELDASRAGGITDLSDTFQQRGLAEEEARIAMDSIQREHDLSLTKADREAEVARIASQNSGGGRGGKELSAKEGLAIINSLWKPGRDGFVSPYQWNELRNDWVSEGFSANTFDSQFGHLVNPAHQRRGRDDLLRYTGISLAGKAKK